MQRTPHSTARTHVVLVVLCLLASGPYAETAEAVYGGEPIDGLEFRHVVLVERGNRTACTGSLIKKDWVLTSASCADDRASGVRVSHLLVDGVVAQRLDAIRTIPHPEFDPGRNINNIALIQLAGDATQAGPTYESDGRLVYTPAPATLATLEPGDRTSAELAGFGPNGTLATVGGVALMTPSQCPSAGQFDWLCLKSSISAWPCGFRDQGGPVGDADEVSGVVTFFPECVPPDDFGHRPQFFFLATSVQPHLDWINSYINAGEPTPGPTPAPTPAPDGISLIWELPPKKSGGVATGISNCQGMTWSSEGPITSIELFVDGKSEGMMPWPSDRGDSPGPALSGFSGAVNWGRFPAGDHTMELVVKDSMGNEKTETRKVKTVKVIPGVNFARDLSADDASCTWTASDTMECTGLSFKQGDCSGTTTFRWLNGKQAMEIIEGCH